MFFFEKKNIVEYKYVRNSKKRSFSSLQDGHNIKKKKREENMSRFFSQTREVITIRGDEVSDKWKLQDVTKEFIYLQLTQAAQPLNAAATESTIGTPEQQQQPTQVDHVYVLFEDGQALNNLLGKITPIFVDVDTGVVTATPKMGHCYKVLSMKQQLELGNALTDGSLTKLKADAELCQSNINDFLFNFMKQMQQQLTTQQQQPQQQSEKPTDMEALD